MELFFAKSASRQFQKLPKSIQKRIDGKLRFYLSQRNPARFADALKDFSFGGWRFRIGDYRLLFDIKKDKIIVLKIGHRKDIYK